MAVTIRDIARELNLSAMTVSRVMSQPDNALVTPATRERVLEAAQRMGYQPNRNARALASGRTGIIGLWISHLKSSVYTQIAEACRSAVAGSGLELSVSEMDWHFGLPEKHRRFAWPVDGILAIDPPSRERVSDLLGSSAWESTPCVNLGSGQEVPWGKDYVWIDLEKGTRTAIEYLLGQGCQRIAYVTPWGLDKPGRSHYDGYSQVLQAAGRSVECIVCDTLYCADVRRTVRDYVQKHGHPDGIFCHHDEYTIATYRALRDLDLDIPKDVALIGCEGNEFLEYFDPPLSTVALPINEMCQQAWSLLQKRINEPTSLPQGITLPFEFLDRPSSQRLPRNSR